MHISRIEPYHDSRTIIGLSGQLVITIEGLKFHVALDNSLPEKIVQSAEIYLKIQYQWRFVAVSQGNYCIVSVPAEQVALFLSKRPLVIRIDLLIASVLQRVSEAFSIKPDS